MYIFGPGMDLDPKLTTALLAEHPAWVMLCITGGKQLMATVLLGNVQSCFLWCPPRGRAEQLPGSIPDVQITQLLESFLPKAKAWP